MIRYVCVNFVWIREHNSSGGDHLRFNQGYLKTTTITVDITVLSPRRREKKIVLVSPFCQLPNACYTMEKYINIFNKDFQVNFYRNGVIIKLSLSNMG